VTGVVAMDRRNDSVRTLPGRPPPAPLPPAGRLAAWLVCGPVGHLVAGVVDWLALVGRYGWRRLRGRDPWGSSGA
jgi:hypothetical protein